MVDPEYYKENRGEIDKIANEEGYRIVIIPDDEKELYPSNFLALHDGRMVMIDAPKTYGEIVKVIGQDKATQVIKLDSSLEENLKLGGGIRCMTALTHPLISLLQVMGYGYDEISALISFKFFT
ncbi:MAG: hypothetical protein NC898_02965 [Candidatus Omnitrophica bacterium]|nr:hypothetical protein [Candidatus Omnitrophota bacterium]MCM8793411.1 hypothetical protein [Candidatus Omnitrophota bacterium]